MWARRFKKRSDDTVVYPNVYDANSNIYQYISGNGGYVAKLKGMGASKLIIGRLLTYDEMNSIKEIGKEDLNEYNYKSILFNGQTTWLGSTLNEENIYIVRSFYYLFGGDGNATISNSIEGYQPNIAYDVGIRPVIEIPTSKIS